jgi:hypothetical protein
MEKVLSYIDLAKQLLSGDFTSYEGRRTLGYPLLLILARLSPNIVWGIQMFAGLVISASLFYLAYELTGNPSVAFIAGMTYNFNLGLLFLEANLIPETETTLFMVGTVAVLAFIHRRIADKNPSWSLVASGVLAGCAVMARPQFIFLPILLGVLVGYRSWILVGKKWRVAWAKACLAASPGILMILASCAFNYVHLGHFTLSTQTGVGLMEHTIAFAELAPDRYRIMRDVLVKHRDLHLAETGRHTATWEAVPELKEVTGLSSLVDLDRELLKLSARLIADHPFRYAALVGDAWISFWLVPNPKGIEKVRPVRIAELLGRVWSFEQPLLRAANAIFLVLLGTAMFSKSFRKRTQWGFLLTAISTNVLLSSFLQAFVIGVDNARYGVTAQPLVFLLVMVAMYQLFSTQAVLQQERAQLAQAESAKGGGK